jgi:hypothetical protein
VSGKGGGGKGGRCDLSIGAVHRSEPEVSNGDVSSLMSFAHLNLKGLGSAFGSDWLIRFSFLHHRILSRIFCTISE